MPVYTDSDTYSFVREQKEQQYRDLKHALCVMGRIELPSGQQRRKTSADRVKTETSAASLQHSQNSSVSRFSQASPSLSSQQSPTPSSRKLVSSSIAHDRSKSECFEEGLSKSIVPVVEIPGSHSSVHSLMPEHFVLIYLLENNRLLLSSVNQMKLEPQV